MEFKDYYQTLGVKPTANADEIKKAYRKLARKYHPDVSKEPDAITRMTALNEANAVLSDPEKRAAYDRLAQEPRAQAGQAYRPPPHWDAGFEFSDGAHSYGPQGQGGAPEDFSDFFEQLFGRAAQARAGASRAHGRSTGSAHDSGAAGSHPQAVRGTDHHARIELDLADSYQGAERTLTLQSAHQADDGALARDERSLLVKIPQGVREGQLIRLAGQGSPGWGGAPAGDLFLEVMFKPDPRWRTEGRDVYQPLMVAPWEAALGASIEVGTPGGSVIEVTVPAGWKAGRKLRLKGRGIPGKPAGDLYLELHIALPPATDDATRAAYASLAQAFAHFNPRAPQGAQP
ncbi:DnaJ C-terminal domain-containing protein [Acidovorax radicis]|uniref:DnaJ C-terminal domain-containing protein n=1 Tax=Acidovorax radicis TaxID=758826 RepID=UPI001CF90044|nr:DnaJ C-terminal domain-containing protein [Acidovorax radicis]UCU98634.1 DnaJ domain-containing protein [Acidovorax radicis]